MEARMNNKGTLGGFANKDSLHQKEKNECF